MFKRTVLKSGLRIITVPFNSVKAVTVLVLVGTGSKYEIDKENGISHFLEHLMFKGTKKRPNALKIAESLDKVGGSFNAFTSKEATGYYAKVDSSHLDLALDWVSDMFLNSKLEQKEIKKEKGVILEEMNMRKDIPMSYVMELFEELLYGNQPAGWEIIGKKENILRFKRKDFVDYLKSHYSSLNTIVCVSGNFKEKETIEKLKKYFKKINKGEVREKLKVIESQKEPKTLVFERETDQTHLCLGVRAFSLNSPQHYAQEVLSVVLGGNMSSRLFSEIRDKRGLAYYIKTSSETYTDSGYVFTQAGVPHNKAKQVLSLILKEYKKIKKELSASELKKAKDYLKGSLILGLESSEAKASFFAGQELLSKKVLTVKEKCARIDKVKSSEVKNLAREIFSSEKLNLALIGPHKKDFKAI